MKTLGNYAEEAVLCLKNKNFLRLAQLIEFNFLMRRQLYGDAVVGFKYIEIFELAKKFNLNCKFTGSGGAFVCLKNNIENKIENNINNLNNNVLEDNQWLIFFFYFFYFLFFVKFYS
jgi:glucuronokinase